MGIFKSKYSSMPDNSYFDRRMANGDSLTDIFDDTDIFSLADKEAKDRPVQVRVGEKYNYVANNFVLFDNWFVGGASFDLYDNCTFAYRRYNEKGIKESKAEQTVLKTDKSRANYYNFYSDRKWGLTENYDLCINRTKLSTQQTVEVIKGYLDAIN